MRYLKKYESFVSRPKGMSEEEYKTLNDMMSKTAYGKKTNPDLKYRGLNIKDVSDVVLKGFQSDIGVEAEESSMNDDEQLEMVSDTIRAINNGSDPLIIHRIIIAEDKNAINLNDVGIHFTIYEDNLDEFRFLDDIGIHNNEDNLPLWKLTCKVRKEDIDVYNTIATNFRFPLENEVMLKPSSEVEVISISPYV